MFQNSKHANQIFWLIYMKETGEPKALSFKMYLHKSGVCMNILEKNSLIIGKKEIKNFSTRINFQHDVFIAFA